MEKDDLKKLKFPTEEDISRLKKDNALRLEWGKRFNN